MHSTRLVALSLTLVFALSACGSSQDKATKDVAPAPTTSATTSPTARPTPKKLAPPCSLVSRALLNKATKATSLNWEEPKKMDASSCGYHSKEGAFFSIFQYRKPGTVFEDRTDCESPSVDLSKTAYVCNTGYEPPYFALGYILKDGRLWGLLLKIKKGGIKSKAEQFFLARLLAEIEGLDPKVILKVME